MKPLQHGLVNYPQAANQSANESTGNDLKTSKANKLHVVYSTIRVRIRFTLRTVCNLWNSENSYTSNLLKSTSNVQAFVMHSRSGVE